VSPSDNKQDKDNRWTIRLDGLCERNMLTRCIEGVKEKFGNCASEMRIVLRDVTLLPNTIIQPTS